MVRFQTILFTISTQFKCQKQFYFTPFSLLKCSFSFTLNGKTYNFKQLLISYIFIDTSGWGIIDISVGFIGRFGSCNIRTPRPIDPLGIDLTRTHIPAAKLRIHTRQMTAEMDLSLCILQQPIRARLL